MSDRIGDLLPNALSRLRVRKTVEASQVCLAVTKALGQQWDYAAPLRAVTYRDGYVTVAVPSSAWAHEVAANSEAIKTSANQQLRGKPVRHLKTRVSPDAARGSDVPR